MFLTINWCWFFSFLMQRAKSPLLGEGWWGGVVRTPINPEAPDVESKRCCRPNTMLLKCSFVGEKDTYFNREKNAHLHCSYSKNPPCGSNGNSWSWSHTAVGHRCFCSDIYSLGGERPIRSCRQPLDQHCLRRQLLRQHGVGDQWFDQRRHLHHLGGEQPLRSGRQPLDQHCLRRQLFRPHGVSDQRLNQRRHLHHLGGELPIRSCRQPLDQHRLRHQPCRQHGVGYQWLDQRRHFHNLGGVLPRLSCRQLLNQHRLRPQHFRQHGVGDHPAIH